MGAARLRVAQSASTSLDVVLAQPTAITAAAETFLLEVDAHANTDAVDARVADAVVFAVGTSTAVKAVLAILSVFTDPLAPTVAA